MTTKQVENEKATEKAQLNEKDLAFLDGVQLTLLLLRSGASADEIAAAVFKQDPALIDPRKYQDLLSELRAILGTDNAIMGSGDALSE